MLSFVFRDSHTRAKFIPIRNPVSPFVFHDLFSMGTSTNTVMFQYGEREHTLRSFLALSVDKEQLFSFLYKRSVLPKSERCPNCDNDAE